MIIFPDFQDFVLQPRSGTYVYIYNPIYITMFVCMYVLYVQYNYIHGSSVFFFFLGVSFYLTERTALLPKKKRAKKIYFLKFFVLL